jgi:DNA polymerase III gamma/tau subunit
MRLPTIVSRCLQFHFAPLGTAEVEKILEERTERKATDRKLAAQLSEGSPGLALEMDVEQTVQRRRDALRVLERAAKGEGFAQLFADTSAMAKDRESSFEEQLQGFYSLLSDLLELTSRARQPLLRNPHLSKELEALSKVIDMPWVMSAISGFDELHVGARRNLNRQLGLDALAASLAPNSQREVGSHR